MLVKSPVGLCVLDADGARASDEMVSTGPAAGKNRANSDVGVGASASTTAENES